MDAALYQNPSSSGALFAKDFPLAINPLSTKMNWPGFSFSVLLAV